MAAGAGEDQLELVARLTGALGVEADRRDPHAAVPWPTMPDVRSVIAHVGGIHRWVAEIVSTGGPVQTAAVPTGPTRAWYETGRAQLLAALAAVPGDAPCWVLGDRLGTAGFWRRRMVYENVKHLMDVRASGGGGWSAAPELGGEGYADGIDELLSEFLPRSRAGLRPLPGAVVLAATDIPRSWRFARDWSVGPGDGDAAGSRSALVRASAADLALALWERADPLRAPDRFRIEGDAGAVAALLDAPLHPW